MLLLSSGNFSLWLLLLTTIISIPVTQGLQFLKNRVLIYFTSFGSEKEFYKTV